MALCIFAAAAPLTGCILFPCGDYVIENTAATTDDGRSYNGKWTETCSASAGTSGTWDLYGDGNAQLVFAPSGNDDNWTLARDIMMEVAFPLERLVVGETIHLEELAAGSAALNPCIDCPQDTVAVSSAEIEVLSGYDGTAPCDEDPGPAFQLRWDVTFGDGAGPTYRAQATDDVEFSVLLSESCGR